MIEKLRSKDPDEVENARLDLLKLGVAALPGLRDAAAKAGDVPVQKILRSLVERLETRQAAAGVARSWGDRWYSVIAGGVHLGWAHLKAEEKAGKVILDDEFHVQANKDVVFHVKATLTCEPNEYLTATSIALDVATPENSLVATAQLKEGRLVVKAGGEVKAQKVSPNLVVDLAVFPLVTVVPRTEGMELEVLELTKVKLPESAILKFDKEETIDFEERRVKTRRFMLAGNGKERFYWVDATNRLLRVQFTGDDEKDVEILLTDEKRARDLDTKE